MDVIYIYVYIYICLYIYMCIECVPIKIKYLYSSLCAPRTLSQVISFYSSWHAPSSLSPVAGSLICLIFFAPRSKVWHSSRSGCCKMGTGWWGWHPRLHWSCEKDPQVLGPAIQCTSWVPQKWRSAKNQHRQLYPWFIHEFSPLTGGRGCMVDNIYIHVYLDIHKIQR